MPLDPLAIAANAISADLRRDFSGLLERSGNLAGQLAHTLRDWQISCTAQLQSEYPYLAHEQQFSDWQHCDPGCVPALDRLEEGVGHFSAFCCVAGVPGSQAFWDKELAAARQAATQADGREQATAVCIRLLETNWQQALDTARVEWELARIESMRQALFLELQALLQLLAQLHEQLHALGFDPGMFVDLSRASLCQQDIEQLQRWVRYLTDDPGVRALCDLLGRLRQLEFSERIERVQQLVQEEVRLPQVDSREEIVGVRLGRDIEHVLPSELALLADPETELLFDLKFVEARLMCFDMQGIQHRRQWVEQTVCEGQREPEQQGPMVICVDTSSSMIGAPETIAKAMALYLSLQARQQGRDCYLINFSTGIETLDLSAKTGMDDVLTFLGKSFHGGTDAAPALDHALQIMQDERYRQADLLMVSDFIMADLSEDQLARIEAQRVHGNCFYSLVVGNCFMKERLVTLFDQEWVYDPETSQLRELLAFQNTLERRTRDAI